jgi:hypothetical protein
MNLMMLALVGLLVYGQSDAIGKVESEFDKKANFAALHTYTWSGGAPALNAEAHRLVVAAFEKEMAARGFKQVASGADVTLSYYNVTSNDVDLKKLEEIEKAGGGTAPTIMRARMLIVMRSAASHQQLWSAITREHVEPTQLAATVTRVAERLFATYPGNKPR